MFCWGARSMVILSTCPWAMTHNVASQALPHGCYSSPRRRKTRILSRLIQALPRTILEKPIRASARAPVPSRRHTEVLNMVSYPVFGQADGPVSRHTATPTERVPARRPPANTPHAGGYVSPRWHEQRREALLQLGFRRSCGLLGSHAESCYNYPHNVDGNHQASVHVHRIYFVATGWRSVITAAARPSSSTRSVFGIANRERTYACGITSCAIPVLRSGPQKLLTATRRFGTARAFKGTVISATRRNLYASAHGFFVTYAGELPAQSDATTLQNEPFSTGGVSISSRTTRN